MAMQISTRQTYGFSLIELSVIITIAATLTIGFLVWTSPTGLTDAIRNVQTHRTMQKVADAIEAFRVQEGRLPCPADPLLREDNTRLPGASTDMYVNPFGTEDLNTTRSATTENAIGVDCPNSIGAVPAHSLGLNTRYMFDAWNRQLIYHVSNSLCGSSTLTAQTNDVTHKQTGCRASDYANHSGDLIVHEDDGTALTESAAYILLSAGANGYGTRLPSAEPVGNPSQSAEIENADGDAIYTVATPGTTFDDILTYRTKSQIEQLTYKKDAQLLSKTKCRTNSTAIHELTTSSLHNLQTTFTTYERNTLNTGDQVTLGLLLTLQEICIEHYGADEAGITAWGGPQCPGNAQYDIASRACECPSGNWDDCCPGGNWDACLDL